MGVQTGLAVRKRFFSNLDCKILEICSPEGRFCHSGLQLDRLSSTGALKGYKSGIRESDPPHKLGKLVHYRCANAA